jgi:GDPmannose 4,6-dehydratase
VREFVEKVFGQHLDLDWERYVRIDPRYYRPTEVDALAATPARPASVSAGRRGSTSTSWCERMVTHDLELARQERTLREAGHVVPPRGLASA